MGAELIERDVRVLATPLAVHLTVQPPTISHRHEPAQVRVPVAGRSEQRQIVTVTAVTGDGELNTDDRPQPDGATALREDHCPIEVVAVSVARVW